MWRMQGVDGGPVVVVESSDHDHVIVLPFPFPLSMLGAYWCARESSFFFGLASC